MTALAFVPERETRGLGRPSTVAPFRPMVLGLLRDDSASSSLAILQQVKGMGYPGGKSALYALIASLRQQHGIAAPSTLRAAEAERRRRERERQRVERAAKLSRWVAEDAARKQRRAREREEKLQREARAREDRARERAGLPVVAAVPEQPEDPTRLRALGRAWLASRVATHKSIGDDKSRWRCHLAPAFGDLLPGEVDVHRIRAFIEAKLAAGMTSTTIGRCIGVLSSLFTHLVESEIALRNPVRAVPRALKRLYRDQHDPRDTPFVESKDDIRRLREALPEPLKTMYCVALLLALRPSELVALEWADVRNNFRSVHVQRGFRNAKLSTPKSGKGRVLPTSPALAEVLRAWHAKRGHTRLVFQPEGSARYLEIAKFRSEWRAAVRQAGLRPITFYCATRHTAASHWVIDGMPIERVSALLGHADIATTQIYSHLRPEMLTVPDVVSFGEGREDAR